MGMTEKEALAMLDEIQEDEKERGFSGDKRFWKLPNKIGKYKIRHLIHPDNKAVGKKVWTHFNIPHDDIKVVTCYRTFGMDCPFCELLEKYENKFETEKWESSLQTKYNALVLNIDDIDPDLPVIMNMSGDYNLKWFLENCFEGEGEDREFFNMTDPEENYIITYKRVKEGGKIERSIAKRATPIAKTEEEIEEILENCYDLEKIWGEPDDNYHDVMKKACSSMKRMIEERLLPLDKTSKKKKYDEDDDDDDTPRKKSKSKKEKMRKDLDDDDDDVEEEPVKKKKSKKREKAEVDEDDEEPPKKKKGKKSKKVVDEDDDEEELPKKKSKKVVDEDDDEEELPKKKKGKKSKKVVDEDDTDDDDGDEEKVPVGSPDCYGDPDVYEKKRRKCMICSHEWDCKKVVAKKLDD